MREERGQALLVLHGAPSNGAFHLWGEVSRPRRVKKSALPRGASIRTLIGALAPVDLSFDPNALERNVGRVWLPTVAKTAVPSSRMIGPPVEGERTLRPWEVDLLSLELD